MDGTTAIKIDYYNELKKKADFVDKMISPSANEIYKEFEELKAKADKYDEKETPFKPTNIKIRPYGSDVSVGNCKCGEFLVSNITYCWNCAQKLDWESEGK